MPLPESIDGIPRKSELKLLAVTVNEDPCNSKKSLVKRVIDCISLEFLNTAATHYKSKSLRCCLTTLFHLCD